MRFLARRVGQSPCLQRPARTGEVSGDGRDVVLHPDLFDLHVEELEVHPLGPESVLVVDESLPASW